MAKLNHQNYAIGTTSSTHWLKKASEYEEENYGKQ
jgi:hypothetical protein